MDDSPVYSCKKLAKSEHSCNFFECNKISGFPFENKYLSHTSLGVDERDPDSAHWLLWSGRGGEVTIAASRGCLERWIQLARCRQEEALKMSNNPLRSAEHHRRATNRTARTKCNRSEFDQWTRGGVLESGLIRSLRRTSASIVSLFRVIRQRTRAERVRMRPFPKQGRWSTRHEAR